MKFEDLNPGTIIKFREDHQGWCNRKTVLHAAAFYKVLAVQFSFSYRYSEKLMADNSSIRFIKVSKYGDEIGGWKSYSTTFIMKEAEISELPTNLPPKKATPRMPRKKPEVDLSLMKDGIGQQIQLGDIVTKVSHDQYVSIYLYRVSFFTPKSVRLVRVNKDTLEDIKSRWGDSQTIGDPASMVVISSLPIIAEKLKEKGLRDSIEAQVNLHNQKDNV